jgi:hypothetical protein
MAPGVEWRQSQAMGLVDNRYPAGTNTYANRSPGQKGMVVIIDARYVIAGESFRFKKDVEARIRRIKDDSPIHRDLDPRDETFVRAFFALHPTKAERLADAAAIHVVPGIGIGDRRFEFYSADGSAIDASYRKPLKALSGLDHHRYSVLDAMRFVAHQQAWEWAVRTHAEAAYDGANDVHHIPPFRVLVDRFLVEEGATFADVALLEEDGMLGSRLSPQWEERWARFHEHHAGYELLSKREHTERHRAA